jgi:hypothetical protein
MKILLVVVLLLTGWNLFSQSSVSNTKWKGHIENPQPLDVVIEFKNDSLIVTSAEGLELEVMSFSQSKDTLKLRKLNGQSPCDFTTEGIYILNFTNSGDTVIFYPITDHCKARAMSISPVVYSRVKE